MSIAIVHYLPLEFYPPVTNMLSLFDSASDNVHVFTTHNDKGRNTYKNDWVYIHRYPLPGKESALKRFYKYMLFNWKVLYQLIRLKPKAVLYFETYSAYPVYLYKKYFNRSVPVFIHCHEYFSPDWYSNSMRLIQYYHGKEKKFLYPSAKWISHTNAKRVELFMADHPKLRKEQFHIMPNYPPATWYDVTKKKNGLPGKIRCVYIGSISISDTYVVEFCEWVKKQGGAVQFDIYCYNLHQSAFDYLKNLNSEHIRLFESGLEYETIPEVLAGYDVGIIFYKATTLNFRYNAPNKLFEYLSCGLDVWFSKEMLGCYDYIRENIRPLVLKVDFADLGNFNYKKFTGREDLPKEITQYTSRQVLQPLLSELT